MEEGHSMDQADIVSAVREAGRTKESIDISVTVKNKGVGCEIWTGKK